MKQKKWFTIHFESDMTGENFDDGVFASIGELKSSCSWDYPGYGSQSIKEIGREEALEMLIAEINERAYEWLTDDAINVNPEGYEIAESAWFSCAMDHIKWTDPGWQLLYDEYFAGDKDLKDQLIKACEKEMQVCKTLFETGQRREMPDGYYTAERALRKITRE